MKYSRARRVLITNTYNKIKLALGHDPEPEERLLLAVVKQSLFDAYMWAPVLYQASAKRFLFGDAMAKVCLDLLIDFEFSQRIIAELAAHMGDDKRMAKLDIALKELTKRRRTEAAAEDICNDCLYGVPENGPVSNYD